MSIHILILLAGLAVYAGYGIPGLVYLLTATLLSYASGLLIPKYKWVMPLTATLNTAALVAVKLQPVTGFVFAAPLGISYFTLQILSYLIDIHRGKYPPERNLLRYGLYITYLPHIFLGPIERYEDFSAALDSRRITWDGISAGGARILWGLFKKLVIAARAGVVISAISADPAGFRGPYALAAMVLYSIQLYSDFSGGMDMVLGASQMLGIRLSENFNVPYASQSLSEFWRRWHMTLGGWLREYVYIPLGGNRKGKLRKWLNTIAVFLVSGLWHGVHYLFWGLFNGIFVALGDKCKTPWKWLNQIGTFLLVSILWAFFVWPDTATALDMIGSLFTDRHYGAFFSDVLNLGLNAAEWAVLGIAVVILWLCDIGMAALRERFSRFCPAGRLAVMGVLALIVLVFGMYGIGFDVEAFIYSSF